jgi:mannosyltransferase OCH1-like enzyme
MHPLLQEWLDRWRRLHPEWLHKIWLTDPELPPHLLHCDSELVGCRSVDLMTRCTPEQRSHVWRYEILEQQGGVCVDADVEPFRSLDSLRDAAPAFAGLCTVSRPARDGTGRLRHWDLVGTAVMGAEPHHPWLRDLVRKTTAQDSSKPASLGAALATATVGKHPDVLLLDPLAFYSAPWYEYALGGSRALRRRDPPAGAYAVCRWSAVWLPRHGLDQLPKDT